MTLFIACLLIHSQGLDWAWYAVAVLVWFFHLAYHN